MSIKMYPDIVIQNDQFLIVEKELKTLQNGAELTTLRKIEEVIRRGLKYSNNVRDEYALLMPELLWSKLLENAKLIRDSYIQKTSQAAPIKRLLDRVSPYKRGIIATYKRIEKLANLQYALNLPVELIQHIFRFLPAPEISKMAMVNKLIYENAKEMQIKRAREFGYVGSELSQANDYLQHLLHAFDSLAKYRYIPKEFVELRKGSFPFLWYIDTEATLRKLDHLNPEEKKVLRIMFSKALIDYTEKGQIETVRVLLGRGAFPNIADHQGRTPLHLAMFGGNKDPRNINKELVLLLLNYGAKPNMPCNEGFTPLCCNTSRPDITELLCERGATVNHQTNMKGYYPLHFAAENGQLETIKVLLKYGANTNVRNNLGESALHLAMTDLNERYEKKKEIISLLLSHRASANIPNRRGMTPLCLCASYPELAELLCEKGAFVNLRTNHKGYHIFHFFAKKGNVDAVRVLLKYGADPSVLDSQDRTPLKIATNAEIKKVLRLYGNF